MFKSISIFLQRLLNIILNFVNFLVGIEIRKRFLLKKQKEVKDEGSKG